MQNIPEHVWTSGKLRWQLDKKQVLFETEIDLYLQLENTAKRHFRFVFSPGALLGIGVK